MNSAQNHVSNVEENILKKLNPPLIDGGMGDANHLPNSEEFIVSESDNRVDNEEKPKDSNETEIIDVGNPSEVEGDNPEKDSEKEKEGDNENSDDSLPKTSILLETEWGSKVYVVGTAHFSEESQEDVARVIRAVQPNIVVLELCQSRSYLLKWEEDEILKIAEKMDFKMIREIARTYGMLHSVLYFLLLSVSVQITRQLGMAPGGEFRRAYKEASNIPGCVVLLGDRPIEITLRRALGSLSWWQSVKFAFSVIFNTTNIDEEEIEKCKNRDYLEEMLGLFGGEFPELKKVFVNERDLFLTDRLIAASLMTTGLHGVVPNTVVGVVGIGHLAGIKRFWNNVDPVEIQQVLQIPPPSKTSRVIKFAFKTSFICFAVYGAYKLACKTRVFSIFT